MKLTDRIQVTVSKKPKTPPPTETIETTASVDYAQIVHDTTEKVAKYVAVGVAGYMLLDTFRQCAIKITPQH